MLTNKIAMEQSLQIEFTVKSLSPITQFDCGFEDPDKPDEFAQDPKKVKATQVTQDTWLAKISTEKLALAPGEHKFFLLFRAKNAVGETISKRTPLLTVPRVAVTKTDDNKPAAPKKGRIVGVVVFKNDTKVKCSSGTVRLDATGDKNSGRKADIDDGKFEFNDVPYGRHMLSAEGEKGGIHARGTLAVDLDDSTRAQTILVED